MPPTSNTSSALHSATLDSLTSRTRHRPHPSSSNPAHHRFASIPSQRKDRTSPSSSAFVLPGKRGKATRLILVAVILFPPVAIFLLAMLPLLLLFTVVFTYSIAWLLYWGMAEPIGLSALPLDPRRVWKLNKVLFSVIFSNFTLIPIGLSLARYRYWTMRGSVDHFTDVHYNLARPKNTLDVYVPRETARTMYSNTYRENPDGKGSLRPVIVFIYGGAWSSGSKLIYTLVGARLRSMGYVVIVPDYSIYPEGKVKMMEQDVKIAIKWAYSNCKDFGGDPQQIFLMGHSAGAHLCAQTVLNDSIKRIPVSLFGSSPAAISTSPILSALLSERLEEGPGDVLPRLRGMILCSGVYDIGEHYKYESSRGVEQVSAMGRVMGSSEATFRLNSPTNVLQELLQVSTRIDRNYPTESQTRHQNMLRHLRSLLPLDILVLHGDRDSTVPARSSSEFFMELKTLQLGAGAKLRIIRGMAHEEPVVALMPCFGRRAPFRKPLMTEIRELIDGDKTFKNARREVHRG